MSLLALLLFGPPSGRSHSEARALFTYLGEQERTGLAVLELGRVCRTPVQNRIAIGLRLL